MHAACISDIDTDKRIVSVEWTEGKDTKGKEVHYIHTCIIYIHMIQALLFVVG